GVREGAHIDHPTARGGGLGLRQQESPEDGAATMATGVEPVGAPRGFGAAPDSIAALAVELHLRLVQRASTKSVLERLHVHVPQHHVDEFALWQCAFHDERLARSEIEAS